MPRLDVQIPTPDGHSPGTLHIPDGTGPWPGVLVFPDAGGVRGLGVATGAGGATGVPVTCVLARLPARSLTVTSYV